MLDRVEDVVNRLIRCFDASPATWTASGWHPERRRGAFLARVAPKSARPPTTAWRGSWKQGGGAEMPVLPHSRPCELDRARRRQSWLISLGNARREQQADAGHCPSPFARDRGRPPTIPPILGGRILPSTTRSSPASASIFTRFRVSSSQNRFFDCVGKV